MCSMSFLDSQTILLKTEILVILWAGFLGSPPNKKTWVYFVE